MFIVIETQATSESVATIVNDYSDRLQAESKYHQILTAAATSQVPKHGAVLLNDEGQMINHECYMHEG